MVAWSAGLDLFNPGKRTTHGRYGAAKQNTESEHEPAQPSRFKSETTHLHATSYESLGLGGFVHKLMHELVEGSAERFLSAVAQAEQGSVCGRGRCGSAATGRDGVAQA